jgi:hypothetical protein
MPFGVLISFDDFLVGYLGEGVSLAHPLHILDGRAGRLMGLAEGDGLLRRNCRDEPDRDVRLETVGDCPTRGKEVPWTHTRRR